MKNSFKVMLTTALLFTATLSTYAQFEDNREPSRFHMGLRAGVSSSTYTGDVSTVDPLWYFTGGLAFDAQVAPFPLFVGWGLNYFNEGVENIKFSNSNYSSYYYKVKKNASTIHIPLVIGYHFNLSPNFFISPYAGGFASYCVEYLDNDKGWKNKNFNCGLRFGLGLNYGRLTFDAAYDLGLKNRGNSYLKMRNRALFLTLGVYLVGKR